jgi:hypothetical protein
VDGVTDDLLVYQSGCWTVLGTWDGTGGNGIGGLVWGQNTLSVSSVGKIVCTPYFPKRWH